MVSSASIENCKHYTKAAINFWMVAVASLLKILSTTSQIGDGKGFFTLRMQVMQATHKQDATPVYSSDGAQYE
eukprot:scaffold96577_cov38-Prasinocladus_malaysianus.AAC.1